MQSSTHPSLHRPDRIMARLLFVTPEYLEEDVAVQTAKARRVIDLSLGFSAVRCIIQYAILPFVLPLIGVAGGFAVHLTMAINIIAIGAIITSLRRFWRIGYKGRWHYLAFGGPALIVLIAFLVLDIRALAGL